MVPGSVGDHMADEELFESERVVPKVVPGQDFLEELGRRSGWDLVEDSTGAPNERYSREQWWQVDDDLFVHTVCDNLSGHCAVSAAGPSQAEADALLTRLAEAIDVFSRAELLAAPSAESDPQERVRAVMRLALGATRDFDRDVFERVSRYTEDPVPGVRDAAIWASGYVAWPPMRTLLRTVAEQDPHEAVRQDARTFLQMYDNAGVPEP